MANTTPDMRQEAQDAERPGRFRAAWEVLRGRAIVPEDIRWEWLQYQLRFNELLDKYAALLARDAKRLQRLEAEEPTPEPQLSLTSLEDRRRVKAQLNSARLGLKNGGAG